MKKEEYEIKYAMCPIYDRPNSRIVVGYMVSKVYVIEKQEKYKVFFPYKVYPNRLSSQYINNKYDIDKNNLDEVDQLFNSYEETQEQVNIQNELLNCQVNNEPIQEAIIVLESKMVVKEDSKNLIKTRKN